VSQGQKVELCHWVVAFVDLLGQGDKMREVSRLLDAGQEDDAVDGMKQIYFDHKDLYEQCQKSFIEHQGEKYRPVMPLPPGASDEEFKSVFSSKLKMQVFSDSVMFFLPLVDDGKNQPLYGINSLLSTLGFQMFSFLILKNPFRCGVDVGFGIEIEDGKLIGPAVQNAYELESQRAKYPRIVVGKGLVEYLGKIQQVGVQKGSPMQNQASKTLASKTIGWLDTDTDGETILNYLGKGLIGDLKDEQTREFKTMIHAFAGEERARFQNLKKKKLADRYASLEAYFAAHMETNG